MPYFSFLTICLVWGASFILMDRASLALGPLAIGVGRMLGGAAVLAVYCAFTRQWTQLRPGDLRHICLVGFLANSLPFVIQPSVMRDAGEHAFFGLLVVFVPLFTILASIPLLRQRPTPRQLVGVLGGLAFAAMIVRDGYQRGFDIRLLVLGLSVPASYALGNTYIKWKLDHLPAAPLTTMFLAAGGLLLLPLRAFPGVTSALGLGAPSAPSDWALALASLGFLSVIGTGVAILLFIQLVQTQGPLFAGMVTYVVPMFALVWGQYDSEALTGGQLLAVGGVLAMVALVQWGAARSSPNAANYSAESDAAA